MLMTRRCPDNRQNVSVVVVDATSWRIVHPGAMVFSSDVGR